jgi:type IV pilus assembly protein PilA
MLKRIFNKKMAGFTLVELLVVVAILGVLAAIVIPNVGKFIGSGKTEANAVELHDVQTAITVAMAQEATGTIAGTEPFLLDKSHDVTIGSTSVGAFLIGTNTALQGSYNLDANGLATPN